VPIFDELDCHFLAEMDHAKSERSVGGTVERALRTARAASAQA
jgi:hypothetical protein